MIKKQLMALFGAGALVLAMTGTALAADNTQYWTGNGVTAGELNNDDCADDSSAHQLWIWTGTGSNVTISVDGEVVAGEQKGQGTYQFETGWHDLAGLTTGPGGNVFVTYDGAADGNAVLTLSHGCAGDEETEEPSFEQSQEGETDEPSDEPSFEQSQEGATEPSTDAFGTNGTSGPADSAWLLVVALGVLLGSVVVVTPARAKGRR